MEEKLKIKFEDYDMEFCEDEFDNMPTEELEKCRKIIEQIKESIS